MTRRTVLGVLAALFLCFAAFAQNPQEPAPLSKQVADLEVKASRQEKTLWDWPNLARYRYANAQLPLPAKDQPRVVFLGDSITDAWPDPRFGEFFPGKPYVGRGISGQTTPQMLVRFRPDVVALHPAAVLILAGTNDLAGNTGPMSLEEIEGNLASMCELAQANRIKVITSATASLPRRVFLKATRRRAGEEDAGKRFIGKRQNQRYESGCAGERGGPGRYDWKGRRAGR